MARLSSSVSLGTGSVSSLIKSAQSLATQEADYQDALAAYTYSNSAYTDEAFKTYSDYLNGRITDLNSTGTLTNAQKALTLTKTLESAMHSNVSASIVRENIAIMGGQATDTQKLDLIGAQYQRAYSNGDLTLAQSLMSQYYSLSQKIQYDAQQAASASAALGRAYAASARSTASGNAADQGDVVTQLSHDLANFKSIAQTEGEGPMNAALKAYAKQAAPQLAALGVKINTSQPNVWDVISGVVGAIYNHKVMQAVAEAQVNPNKATNYLNDATDIMRGITKFDTPTRNQMTLQQIQQAAQDPAMFAYNGATGQFELTKTIGYQYQTFTGYNTDSAGNVQTYQYQALVPQYSGYRVGNPQNKVYLLTPTQTMAMQTLGLNFGENPPAKGQATGTTGDGVTVQATANTPQWLRQLMAGDSGDLNPMSQMYTDQQGGLIFAGNSVTGQGRAFFTLMKDANGHFGVFEHMADGTTIRAGSDYGFNWGAASLLVQTGQLLQQQILQAAARAAALLPKISVPKVSAPPPPIAQPPRAPALPRISLASNYRPTNIAPNYSVQAPNVAPGVPKPSGSGAINVQGGNNFNLLTSGGGGIRL